MNKLHPQVTDVPETDYDEDIIHFVFDDGNTTYCDLYLPNDGLVGPDVVVNCPTCIDEEFAFMMEDEGLL